MAEAARAAADAGCVNVSFARGDAYVIDAGDGAFDVVHAHQVLQHLGDPIAALTRDASGAPTGRAARRARQRLRRVRVGPGRPSSRPLDAAVPPAHRAQRGASRRRPLAAGLGGGRRVRRPRVSSSTWTFADPADRTWWGQLWAERVASLVVRHAGQGVTASATSRARRHRRGVRDVGGRAERRCSSSSTSRCSPAPRSDRPPRASGEDPGQGLTRIFPRSSIDVNLPQMWRQSSASGSSSRPRPNAARGRRRRRRCRSRRCTYSGWRRRAWRRARRRRRPARRHRRGVRSSSNSVTSASSWSTMSS